MSEPVCVLEAVKEYKAEMDLLAGFIEEKIEIDYNCKDRVPAKDLFQAYLKWAKENNEFEMTSKKFFTEMGKRLPEKGRSGKGIYYKYIRILKDTETKQYNIADFYKGGTAV
jgi:putative DNA primase/helicase